MSAVEYRIEGRIAVLTIENPPVNALSAEVLESLRSAVGRAIGDSSVDAAVLIGAGNTFVAGADIKNLEGMARKGKVHSGLPQLISSIEMAPKPFIAALHGNAFGGGLELAMGCHYRISAADARVGQPEVKLGIIPGAGGTQRLPRLAGVQAALEMCCFGEPIRAEEALRLGIIDRIAEGDLLTSAIRFAETVRTPRPTRDIDPESHVGVIGIYREKVRTTLRNLAAPLAAIDAIQAAVELPFEEGCRREREIFEHLLVSSQARALIHVFLAERAASKVPGIEKNAETIPIQTAAVIGAGTMGRGIAICFANFGMPVLLRDTKQEALDAAVKSIEGIYLSSVRKGKLSTEEMQVRRSRIRPQLDYSGFDATDIVVEAAFEDTGVKRAVFAEVSGFAKPSAILATNTSYQNIDDIALASSHPERVIGLHFFSPANVMRLVEVVPGTATLALVTASALTLAKRLGKLAVVAGNCPGFIGNRMLRVYRREAHLLLEEGASPKQVDSAVEQWGMAMGPFAMQDLAGIDIAIKSRSAFAAIDAGTRQSRVMESLFAQGRLGQKTGAGWYRYDENRNAQPDPEVGALIDRAAREAGTVQRSISSEEIVERTIYALVNEGARILDEGFALRASDIDLVYINGYGFPAWRGGPLHYADEIGLNAVYRRIVEFRAIHGINWEPNPLLARLAESGGSFSDLGRRPIMLNPIMLNTGSFR